MRTEICDQLGIEFPIFAFTHCRDVVVAVSNAGGLGVLGAVGFPPEQLATELDWIDEHTDKPYGVDVVIPGKYEGMGELDPGEARGRADGDDPRGAPRVRAHAARRPRRARDARRRGGPGSDRLDRGHRHGRWSTRRSVTTRSG